MLQQLQSVLLTILQAQNDLWRSIEAADQVGSDLIVSREHGAAKVGQLDHGPAGADKDVVRLDIGMQHPAVAQVVEGDEHLGCVLGHCSNVEPNAATILLRQLTQVDVLQGKHDSVGRPKGAAALSNTGVTPVYRAGLTQLHRHASRVCFASTVMPSGAGLLL